MGRLSDVNDPSLVNDASSADTSKEVYDSESPVADLALLKRATRKLDYTILPLVGLIYLLSWLDRANIGNAKVAGLQRDLHLSDRQYQIGVTMMFIPYILSELPSNLILRKIGARWLLSCLLISWGIVVIFQGFVTSYAGLVVVRLLLGLFEGPIYPGIVLYLSSLYTREQLSLRIALFFSSASLSGAFSGLLAAAIENMDGIGGKAGWRWIFILEGLLSALVGVFTLCLLPSIPQDSIFLTSAEKDAVVHHLERSRPNMGKESFSSSEIIKSLKSPHVILLFVLFFMVGTLIYEIALFLPTIVNELGFSPNKTQLLSVGPFAAGFIITATAAYLSDRYRLRGVPAAIISALGVAGFALYLCTHDKFVAYGSLFLSVPGVYGAAPILSAWMANNSEPYYRRATSIAIAFISTNLGGILSTWRFPSSEAPRYTRTTIMGMIFSALILVGSLVNITLLMRLNKNKALHREKILEPYLEGEAREKNPELAWMKLGDRHPDFIYTL